MAEYISEKEGITWEDLGFTKKHRFSQLLKGFSLGIIFVVIYISILIAMKQVVFTYNRLNINILCSLFAGLIIFCGVAFVEEVTFRGYIQNSLCKENEFVGLIMTAMIFALTHLQNHPPLSLIYLTIGGILFGIMRMVTNNIWFPLGCHIAWNWTEIRVFGLGNDTHNHWFSTDITQNTIWNGGESGTGLIVVLTEVVFILFFAYFLKTQKKN